MTLFHVLHIEILPFCGFNCDCLVPDHVVVFSSQVLKCKSLAAQENKHIKVISGDISKQLPVVFTTFISTEQMLHASALLIYQ